MRRKPGFQGNMVIHRAASFNRRPFSFNHQPSISLTWHRIRACPPLQMLGNVSNSVPGGRWRTKHGHSPNSRTTANKIFSRRSGPGLLQAWRLGARDAVHAIRIYSRIPHNETPMNNQEYHVPGKEGIFPIKCI
ncbi:hypothetical protein F4776DRAFT_609085 [Hypoxylon sp. NC0597]|nr:hypothetical protein F4776DRAFT_609085 [Hypoxylon sp. NC0597]